MLGELRDSRAAFALWERGKVRSLSLFGMVVYVHCPREEGLMPGVPKDRSSMPNKSATIDGRAAQSGEASVAREDTVLLADFVWRWRWEEPGVWRAVAGDPPVFLGHTVMSGALAEVLSSWLSPPEESRFRWLLERARKGQSERVELRIRDASGSVYRVRVAALAPPVAESPEVLVAFAVLSPAAALASMEQLCVPLTGQATDYERSARDVLSVLRHRLGCAAAELRLHGVLEEAPERLWVDARTPGSGWAVRESAPTYRLEKQVELPLTVGDELLATLHIHGLPRETLPEDERWRAAAEALEALRKTLLEWSLACHRKRWDKVSEFLRVACKEMAHPRSDALRELCRAVAAVFGADRAHLWFVEANSGTYHLLAHWGFSEEDIEALQVLELPVWMAEAASGATTVAKANILQPPENLDGPGATQQLSLQLDHGGVLFVDWKKEAPKFSEGFTNVVCRVASLWFAGARLATEADQAARLKADFVATMSHELRTPLNTLMGYTDLLACEEFGPLTVEQRDVLGRMSRSAQELLELINATLDFGRIQSHDVPLELGVVSIPDLLAEIDRELAYSRQRRGLSWAVQVDPAAAQVRTDREKLKVVLKNLLTNAIKFTEQGGVSVEVQSVGSDIEIAVRDTGIGIAPALLPAIFEPFRQGEPASTRRFGGVGLGLYVVRRLVELLGGSVSVESELTKGSVFRVRLPNLLLAERGSS